MSDVEERFWRKVNLLGSCWEWTGNRMKGGYGTFAFRKGTWGAHRVAYTLCVAEIPDDKMLLHSCDNPGCVNPAHLRVGSHKDNMEDKVARGRQRNGKESQTHCKRGHPLSGDNVYFKPSRPNSRNCRECKRERERKFKV